MTPSSGSWSMMRWRRLAERGGAPAPGTGSGPGKADGTAGAGEFGLAACTRMVRRHDGVRYRIARLAPPEARAHLHVLFAFNLEIARIPWAVSEPGLGAIRLRWWQDMIAAAARGDAVPRSDLLTPLAARLGAGVFDAGAFEALVAARTHDLAPEMFADRAAFEAYLAATGGTLLAEAGRALGADGAARDLLHRLGTIDGLARYLSALPALAARGRRPLPDDLDAAALAGVIEEASAELAALRPALRRLPRRLRPALALAHAARPLLARMRRAPGALSAPGIRLSPLAREWALRRAVFLGP